VSALVWPATYGSRVACVGFGVASSAVMGVVCGGRGVRGQRRPFCPMP